MQTAATPEATIRAVMTALYANDVAAFERVTLPHPKRAMLTARSSRNEEKLRQLKEDPRGLQINQQRPFLYQGREVPVAKAPVGTTGIFMVAHYGNPMIVPVVRKDDGWKIDVRWWIGMMEVATTMGPPPKDSSEFAIKSLLFEMLALNRSRAATYLTDPKAIDVLFTGAPRQREPSSILESSVAEMAIVDALPGEFYVLPQGKIVEGMTPTAEKKVVVGLFGPSEMVFVVEKSKGGWKIVAEPYFGILNR